MSLKLYYDLLSQPSRALYIFLKKCNIPFESKLINLGKGEHYQEAFENINPFKLVPVIEHGEFKLTESVAILRYLCREFKVEDYWYPKDSKLRARVDEYLEWQHLNTRLHCALYFRITFVTPLLKGKPPKPEQVREFEGRMAECLDKIEDIWLRDKPFLTGDRISIADIIGACEVEQPRIVGYDPTEGRPKLTAWLERVRRDLSPFYEEAHAKLNKLAVKYQQGNSKL